MIKDIFMVMILIALNVYQTTVIFFRDYNIKFVYILK